MPQPSPHWEAVKLVRVTAKCILPRWIPENKNHHHPRRLQPVLPASTAKLKEEADVSTPISSAEGRHQRWSSFFFLFWKRHGAFKSPGLCTGWTPGRYSVVPFEAQLHTLERHKPTDQPTDQPIDQPTVQPTNQPASQLTWAQDRWIQAKDAPAAQSTMPPPSRLCCVLVPNESDRPDSCRDRLASILQSGVHHGWAPGYGLNGNKSVCYV